MDLKDIGKMNLDEMGDFFKQAQDVISDKMETLSEGDKLKVNTFMEGVDRTNISEMESKLSELKNNKDVS